MKIGALIVTTGLSRISGVAALLSEVGTISAVPSLHLTDHAVKPNFSGGAGNQARQRLSPPAGW